MGMHIFCIDHEASIILLINHHRLEASVSVCLYKFRFFPLVLNLSIAARQGDNI